MSLWNGFDIPRFRDPNTGNLLDDVVIITLDLGHGQCSACFVEKGGLVGINPDLVFSNEARVIPSAIVYSGEEIKIGKQAAGKKGCIFYFKDSPIHFGDIYLKHTKKQLMQDFVSELFKALVDNNKQRFSQNSNVLLLVGCPSSENEWLSHKNEYAQMIQEAVNGYVKDVCVVILPESRAAFFNIAAKKNLYANEGVLVLDFGSSTADATWMQTGKKPIEKSWRLGAAEIEKKMLETVLEDKGYHLSDLTSEDLEQYKWAFRQNKEMFYDNQVIPKNFILIRDENGGIRNFIEVDNIDEKFMQRITGSCSENKSTKAVQIKLRGDGRMGSWAEHCRRFIREVLLEMRSSGCACKEVILTGGASKMEFIRTICREEIKNIYHTQNIEVELSDEPSFSVSRGLAQAALNDLNAEEKRSELAKILHSDIEKELDKFSSNAASKLAKKYYNIAVPVIEQWADDKQTPENQRNSKYLKDKISKEFRKNIKQYDIENTLVQSFNTTMGNCRDHIQAVVNKNLQEIYNNKLDENSYKLDEKKWKEIMEKCDAGKLCNPELPDLLNMNALEWTLVIILVLPVAIIDGIFDSDFSDKVIESLYKLIDGRKQWQSTRQRALQSAKNNYKDNIKGKIEEVIKNMIKEQRETGNLQLEELIVEALDDAFDVIAFYGE